MSLTREDGRQPVTPDPLHRCKNAQLVVYNNIMPGRVVALNVIQHLLLVHIDENAAFDHIPQARSLHFTRLEDHVSIGQDDRLPPGVWRSRAWSAPG